jgi:hypothetical protein
MFYSGIDLINENLLYQCAGLIAPSAQTTFGSSSFPAAAAAASELGNSLTPSVTDPPPNQAFNLSSRPSSINKIWLDFKGNSYTKTAWNTAYNKPTITVPPYDFDNNPSGFSVDEKRV